MSFGRAFHWAVAFTQKADCPKALRKKRYKTFSRWIYSHTFYGILRESQHAMEGGARPFKILDATHGFENDLKLPKLRRCLSSMQRLWYCIDLFVFQVCFYQPERLVSLPHTWWNTATWEGIVVCIKVLAASTERHSLMCQYVCQVAFDVQGVFFVFFLKIWI